MAVNCLGSKLGSKLGIKTVGIKTKALLGAMVVLAAISSASEAQAGKKINPEDLPLHGLSVGEQMDQEAILWRYYLDDSLGGEAIFLFGVPNYNDTRQTRAGKRIEAYYNDLLRQQSDSPIVRTRDLQSPYCSSLLGTATGCDLAVQPPPTPMPPMPMLPPAPMMPPAPVPALY
jgi:hypothetical protein